MSDGYSGKALTLAELEVITAAFRAAGGVVDQSEAAQQYLKARGAGGLTLNKDTILLPPGPTRTAVHEELIHADQFRSGIVEAGGTTLLELEVVTAETLVRNRHHWQLPWEEVRQVIRNRRIMREELLRLRAQP